MQIAILHTLAQSVGFLCSAMAQYSLETKHWHTAKRAKRVKQVGFFDFTGHLPCLKKIDFSHFEPQNRFFSRNGDKIQKLIEIPLQNS